MGGRGCYSKTGKSSFIRIRKSIGATFYINRIKDIDGSITNIAVDTTIENIEVIAGRGVSRKIDEIKRLQEKYGGKEREYQKIKGVGYIKRNEIIRKVELHWYEIESYPITLEMKVVKYLYD